MDSEISKDIPALIGIVRTIDRLQRQHPELEINVDSIVHTLESEQSKKIVRILLQREEKPNALLKAKAEAIRQLALGR